MCALVAKGFSIPQVAKAMNRAASTIYRERTRNLRPSGYYAASVADSYATARRRRSRRGSQFSDDDWRLISALISIRWSPEQIANKLKQYQTLNISFQTIYRMVHRDRNHGGTIYKDLRHIPKVRRKKRGSADSRGVLPGKRPLSERPEAANSRLEFGHWEGDTVMGADRHECVLTLVERKSGYAFVSKLTNRTAKNVNIELRKIISRKPHLFKSITFDNGTEFHSYAEIENEFNVTCYFARPYHSWERGCNENFNGLLRQYLPKGKSMHYIGEVRLSKIVAELNTRPRKRLAFKSPQKLYFG
jgi:IS30 family transposase